VEAPPGLMAIAAMAGGAKDRLALGLKDHLTATATGLKSGHVAIPAYAASEAAVPVRIAWIEAASREARSFLAISGSRSSRATRASAFR